MNVNKKIQTKGIFRFLRFLYDCFFFKVDAPSFEDRLCSFLFLLKHEVKSISLNSISPFALIYVLFLFFVLGNFLIIVNNNYRISNSSARALRFFHTNVYLLVVFIFNFILICFLCHLVHPSVMNYN